MSNERQETVADIVADMRELAADIETGNAVVGQTVWRNYADRIEAAWKAERERAKADALVVGGMVEAMRREKRGNAAKMREAYEFAEEFLRDYGTDWKLHNKLCDMLKSALAEPERNCDVGTAEEQAERFAEYCDSEACKRNRCKSRAKALCIERCAIAWAQMPYEEGGAK